MTHAYAAVHHPPPRNDLPYREGNALFSLTKASRYGAASTCSPLTPPNTILYLTPSYVGNYPHYDHDAYVDLRGQ